jgi:hypothetical protein
MYVVKDRFGFPIAYVSEVHQYRSAGSNAKVMADAPVFIEMLAKIIDAFDLTQVALSEGNKERAIEYGAMSFEAVAAAKRFLNPNQALHYNKSLGGAIISSRKKLFQLTHIAAINNVKYRNIGNSIILDESELLTFKAHYNDFKNSVLTVDRTVHQLDGSTSVEIKLSDRVINILVPESNEFYKRVRKAFID